jgi:hypothetical protein
MYDPRFDVILERHQKLIREAEMYQLLSRQQPASSALEMLNNLVRAWSVLLSRLRRMVLDAVPR